MVRVRGELPVERLNSYCSWEAESRGAKKMPTEQLHYYNSWVTESRGAYWI